MSGMGVSGVTTTTGTPAFFERRIMLLVPGEKTVSRKKATHSVAPGEYDKSLSSIC